MSRKIKSNIISANLTNIKNEQTGEVTQLTRIQYLIDREDTDILLGSSLLESYKVGNFISKLKGKTNTPVMLEVDEVPTKNGIKFKLASVDGVKL